MLWKSKSSVIIIIVLFVAVGLVVNLSSGLAQTTSEFSPFLISLDVKQMDLQDILRLIAEKANINIIAGKEVSGLVTLKLKDVDIWLVLETVLEMNGFGYREKDGIILVEKTGKLVEEKLPLITEIILLKYVKAEEIKEICRHFLSPSGTISVDIRINALIIRDISQNIEKIKKEVSKLDVEPPPALEERRFQLSYVDTAEKDKRDLLNEILRNIIGGKGNFFIDPLTNSVYVEAPFFCMEKVEEYFKRINVPPIRIMIKAEFVEVRLSDLNEIDINWQWKGAYGSYPLETTVRYPPSSTSAAGMGIIFGNIEQAFRGMIDLLVSKQKANLLSCPSIVTLDGKEARIHVGDKYPYKVKTYKEGELIETTEFINLGTTLLVTPHVKEGKRVILDVRPEVNEITAHERWEGGPPVVGDRAAQTHIEVEDGKTIVIGGLLRDIASETMEGVPFLSSLSIFGSLFTYRKTITEKTDLLIFITPYILPEKMEEDTAEKRKPTKVKIEEIYQEELNYKKDILAVGLGEWYPSTGIDPFMIYEAQLRLGENLRLFGGGGRSFNNSSYISYLGVKTEGKLNIGVGGIQSSAFERAEFLFCTGIFLEIDKTRIQIDYFYVPKKEEVNGIRAFIGVRL